MMEIDLHIVNEYFVSHGLVDKDEILSSELLPGGVSSTIIKVNTTRGSFVIKQPLSKLAVKDDWFADLGRIFNEKECMDTLSALIGEALVPRVVFFDKENYALVMTCVPEDCVLWKTQLLDGRVDQMIAGKVATVLADIHGKTFRNESVERKFKSQKIFCQLRIEPYHRAVAKRHPDVAAVVDEEVQRLLETRICLVHGDYSPKNIFVRQGEIILVDHEIAHYGDPTLDFAFCLNHLLLKFVHKSMRSQRVEYEYLKAAQSYVEAYLRSAPFSDTKGFKANTVRELGCLMLARIDGKSPVEYITDEETKRVARNIGKDILLGTWETVDEVLELVKERIQDAQASALAPTLPKAEERSK